MVVPCFWRVSVSRIWTVEVARVVPAALRYVLSKILTSSSPEVTLLFPQVILAIFSQDWADIGIVYSRERSCKCFPSPFGVRVGLALRIRLATDSSRGKYAAKRPGESYIYCENRGNTGIPGRDDYTSCDVRCREFMADDITRPSCSNRGSSSSWKRRNDAVNVISAFMLTSVAICFTYPLSSCRPHSVPSCYLGGVALHCTHDLSCFAL